MSVVGVDFGNQNAVIAAAGRGGVDVLLNGSSNRLNPTMVGFSESRSMGESATTGASSNYKNTITNMKRLVGLAFNDPRSVREMSYCNFSCVPVKHAVGADTIGVKVQYGGEEKVVPVEAVSGMMVKHLGLIAAKKTADVFPKDWVVAIPGYYTDAQRRAFLSGMESVGVAGCQRLMHETTATALAYGIFKDIKKQFSKDAPTNVMFIDLGATSYSVSITEFVPGKLSVKSSQYDPYLGGRDIDALIAEFLASKFEEKYKSRLSGKPMERPKTRIKLYSAAEKAKKTLSPQGVKEARVNLECLMDDLDFGVTLKNDDYEQMMKPFLARLRAPIERALAETGLKSSDLASIEIVGGSTRIGCVKTTLAEILGLDAAATNSGLSATMNADEAVARGAALQSAILSPRFKVLPYEICEYNPYPVKIAWDGETSDSGEGIEVEGEAEGSSGMPSNSVVMFDRGSAFPVVRRVTLRRAGEFVVTASYDGSAAHHGYPEGVGSEIAAFKIRAPAGTDESKIRVNVKQDVHGSVVMSSVQMLVEEEEEVKDEPMPPADAEEAKKEEGEAAAADAAKKDDAPKKKKVKKVALEYEESRPIQWTKAEQEQAYETEVAMSNADRIIRETADMRNELESYIYDMRDKIVSESQLAPYCTDAEKSALSSALETSENWLYEDGFNAGKTAFADKLADLRKLGDPLVYRKSEAKLRPAAVSSLQRACEKYMNWLNTSEGEESYSHITYEERTKCYDLCDSTSSWMYDMLDKQGSASQSSDPAVSTAEINTKIRQLNDTVSPVMHKPKPKPKPVPKAEDDKGKDKTTPAPSSEGEEKKKQEGSSPEPMDIDGASKNGDDGDGRGVV